jgi:hypothetical protein
MLWQMHSQERMKMLRPFSVLSRSSNPDWIIKARDEWKNDENVWILIQRLQQDSSASDTFTWKNDSLWYKDHLYLCKNSQIKQKVLLELHTSPVGGNSGFLKTYHRVKKEFFWDGLKTDVQRFCGRMFGFPTK